MQWRIKLLPDLRATSAANGRAHPVNYPVHSIPGHHKRVMLEDAVDIQTLQQQQQQQYLYIHI